MEMTSPRTRIGSKCQSPAFRLLSTAFAGCLVASSVATSPDVFAQQLGAQQPVGQQPMQGQQAGGQAAQAAAPAQQPFPPLTPQQQAQLDQVLLAWQAQSQGTKTLECKFQRWHFDLMAAPAGIHAHKAEGEIKYAKPDKGLFRVDSMMFYKGMVAGKPQFGPNPKAFGEYWVCNGVELIEYDRAEEQCNVKTLPPDMQGTEIFNSPLPFVFNLDAAKIKQRYWVLLKQSPKPNTFLIQAWPKLQEDRAQYKMVQVVLSATFEPEVLIMYAPNFHEKLAPQWDHYEFSDVKRNAALASVRDFMGNFIPKKPPATWKITREPLLPPQIAQGQPKAGPPQR